MSRSIFSTATGRTGTMASAVICLWCLRMEAPLRAISRRERTTTFRRTSGAGRGTFIAYHAQLTPGYEADRWRILLYDRTAGRIENLTETFDRSADELAWSPDSKTIY